MRIYTFLLLCIIHSTNILADNSTLLHRYYQIESCQPTLKMLSQHEDLLGVKHYSFDFQSLCWPTDTSIWHHRLNLFIPNNSSHNQAIFFVHGGTNHIPRGLSHGDPYENPAIDTGLSLVALATSAIVIELKDVPNQYLTVAPDKHLNEDLLLAFSWLQSMLGNGEFWPAQLPMAKAASLAIDAIESIADDYNFIPPEKYLITGLSKRGWSSWLTALEDTRINAIIPGVIGILDTKNTALHIKNSLGDWPLAFSSYKQNSLAEWINTDNFNQLMLGIDPWSYYEHEDYFDRFNIPKLTIIASNDDFFVPDSQNHLIKTMPGKNYFRVLPNMSHYIDIKSYLESTISFYKALVGDLTLPELTWKDEDNHLQQVFCSFKPVKALLWTANNPNGRDFRYRSNITYEKEALDPKCDSMGCYIDIPQEKLTTGYTAQFVELHFDHNMILTTPVFITPDTYPTIREQ